MTDKPIALGWRVHSSSAIVVAVQGSARSPVVVHREQVTLVDDESLREPYHAAVAVPIAEAPALIASVKRIAVDAAVAAVRELAAFLGQIVAVGVVGGDRQVPELARILAAHARLHAAERDLYERAIVEGAAEVGLAVATIPATGKLFDYASEVVGAAVEPSLAALGKTIGPPWQKDYREAAAAALVALHMVSTS
jgi:hypothetical protein